jgi:N-acetylmuramoyl-L-alanine amidase
MTKFVRSLRTVRARVWSAAVATAAVVLTIATFAAQAPAPPAPYTVVSRTTRQPLPARSVSGQEMFALDDLARLFPLTVREDALAGGLTIAVNNQTIVLTAQQPLASVAGRMISLPAAPVHDGRTWLVPVDFVSRALAPILGSPLELRKPSRLILVGDVRMPRIAGRVETLGAVTRVTLDVAPPTPHQITQAGSHLTIRFDADGLDTPFPSADAPGNPAPGDLRSAANDAFKGVFVGDPAGVLTIELGPRFASFRATDQPAPGGATRIVIDLIAQTETAPVPSAPASAAPAPSTAEPPPLLDLPPTGGLRTIVIDPGHGGDENGARGEKGTLEKNVTLAVARRLKGTLEGRLGVRVLLTRDGDQTLPLDQRAAVANNNKADLFISLHANASLRSAIGGAEVFYLDLAEYGDEAQRAAPASAESLPVLGGGSRDIEVMLWEMAQARYIDQSAAFARTVAAALHDRVAMSRRPIQQAPFRVLGGANMPAILIEMGFLSNPQQEQQLAGDDYQNAIAQALVEGIVRFRGASPPGTR